MAGTAVAGTAVGVAAGTAAGVVAGAAAGVVAGAAAGVVAGAAAGATAGRLGRLGRLVPSLVQLRLLARLRVLRPQLRRLQLLLPRLRVLLVASPFETAQLRASTVTPGAGFWGNLRGREAAAGPVRHTESEVFMRLTALASVFVLLASGPAAPAQVGEAAPAPGPRPRAGQRGPGAQAARPGAGVRERPPASRRSRSPSSTTASTASTAAAATCRQDAVVVEHYDPDFVRRFKLGDPDYRKPLDAANRHGRIMAQIVWAVTGSHPDGPRFYLLNANGPTMLRRAVRYAIEQKVDLILFSGTFEGGGNGDGRGPINRIVADALAADILWVNAAGNYGRRVYNGPVRVCPDGYLRLRDGVRRRRPAIPQPPRREHRHRHAHLERLPRAGGRRHRQGPRPLRRGLGRPARRRPARRCRSPATRSPGPTRAATRASASS